MKAVSIAILLFVSSSALASLAGSYDVEAVTKCHYNGNKLEVSEVPVCQTKKVDVQISEDESSVVLNMFYKPEGDETFMSSSQNCKRENLCFSNDLSVRGLDIQFTEFMNVDNLPSLHVTKLKRVGDKVVLSIEWRNYFHTGKSDYDFEFVLNPK